MSPSLSPEERRKRVLSSHAFNTWWDEREHVEPVPVNPYQAFMIDLSLHAKIEDRRKWERQPNRNDLIDIDFPHGDVPTWAPAKKSPRRREPPYKSPEMPKGGEARAIHLAVEAMTQRHGIETPEIETTHREGHIKAYSSVGLARYPDMKGGYRIGAYGRPLVHVGVQGEGGGKVRAREVATALHEGGHVIHGQNLLGLGNLPKGTASFTGEKSNYSDEQVATNLARAEMRRTFPKKGGALGVGMWTLAYGLHTYRRGWERRGNPVVIEQGTNKILSGGTNKRLS